MRARTPRERDRLTQAILFAGFVVFTATMYAMTMLVLLAHGAAR